MTKNNIFARWRITKNCGPFFAVLALNNGVLNGEVNEDLDELVVSASRLPGDAETESSAVTVLDPTELKSRGIRNLRDALNEVPGVISTSTAGQSGAVGSLFIRGTTTSYSQIVVDGMRVSDSTAAAGNFLSGAQISGLSRIEVLRGPQSAIHGGEAVGGIVWLETGRSEQVNQGSLFVEGGSFDTLNTSVESSGQSEELSWFGELGTNQSHNDVSNQDYDLVSGAMRLEWKQSAQLTLGMTYRASDSRYEYDSFGENVDHLDSSLATIYAVAEFAPGWDGRFMLGHYRENYDNENRSAAGVFGFGTDVERIVFSTDQRVVFGENYELLGGAFVEENDFKNSIGTDQDELRLGAYLGWTWTPLSNFALDSVLRWEDYADYGDEMTWRVGASWEVAENTRIRGGIGRAFRTPTYLDLFGTAFGAGNLALEAEDSLGWDLGLEREIFDNHALSVTWFENSIDGRIQSFPTPPINLGGTTKTEGLEIGLSGGWRDNRIRYRANWTFLGESISDQPKHSGSASLDWQISEKLLIGIGASYVDQRSYGGAALDDYLLMRLYGSYELNENISLNCRVENATDQDYDLANFGTAIPGAGFGVFGGLQVRF